MPVSFGRFSNTGPGYRLNMPLSEDTEVADHLPGKRLGNRLARIGEDLLAHGVSQWLYQGSRQPKRESHAAFSDTDAD